MSQRLAQVHDFSRSLQFHRARRRAAGRDDRGGCETDAEPPDAARSVAQRFNLGPNRLGSGADQSSARHPPIQPRRHASPPSACPLFVPSSLLLCCSARAPESRRAAEQQSIACPRETQPSGSTWGRIVWDQVRIRAPRVARRFNPVDTPVHPAPALCSFPALCFSAALREPLNRAEQQSSRAAEHCLSARNAAQRFNLGPNRLGSGADQIFARRPPIQPRRHASPPSASPLVRALLSASLLLCASP
jgi:hypothetical protein